jgi:hypothetical protein
MQRELIVIAKPNVNFNISNEDTTSFSNRETDSLESILVSKQAQIRPLFDVEQIQPASFLPVESNMEMPDFSKYYKVNAPDEKLEELVEQLRSHKLVENAYIKPAAELARIVVEPTEDVARSVTPDFTSKQGYLDAAPGGIDARYAWGFSGGKGNEVKIIDIEGAWRFSHEDLKENKGGVIGGTPSSDIRWRNHGTAVLGVISGNENPFGITGISPDAKVHAISVFGQGTSTAILQAANALDAGDIILIEIHRPGPRFGYQEREDQKGYIAIEWWQDDFDAIRFATSKGVIVVEAAGNGAENLDDEIYESRFNRSHRDSGAIIVGAGAPPPGTHGSDYGPDRSRLEFSNYGAIIDAQGWGREVTTTGYSDLHSGVNEDVWYTDIFSGTSSASPIVVGTLACLQGIVKSRGQVPLKPLPTRELLRNSGSSQQDAPTIPKSQRIGNRPNLKQLIALINFDENNIPDVSRRVVLYAQARNFLTGFCTYRYEPGSNGYKLELILIPSTSAVMRYERREDLGITDENNIPDVARRVAKFAQSLKDPSGQPYLTGFTTFHADDIGTGRRLELILLPYSTSAIMRYERREDLGITDENNIPDVARRVAEFAKSQKDPNGQSYLTGFTTFHADDIGTGRRLELILLPQNAATTVFESKSEL